MKNNKNNKQYSAKQFIIIIVLIAVAATNLFMKENSSKEAEKQEYVTEQSKETKQSEEKEVSGKSYTFANERLLNEHYEKHGKEMGFKSAEEYEKAASAVVNNKDALHKTEEEDGDDVYYLEKTNELVIVSTRGSIRTYFSPDAGIDYFNRT